MPGPVPKRSSERRRRGREYGLLESVEIEGGVEPPSADPSWHPIASDWFESLKASAQSKFYEPSDWMFAVVWASILSQQMTGRPSSRMMASWSAAAADLLTTEASRRRVRMEVNRRTLSAVPDPASGLDAYRDL